MTDHAAVLTFRGQSCVKFRAVLPSLRLTKWKLPLLLQDTETALKSHVCDTRQKVPTLFRQQNRAQVTCVAAEEKNFKKGKKGQKITIWKAEKKSGILILIFSYYIRAFHRKQGTTSTQGSYTQIKRDSFILSF